MCDAPHKKKQFAQHFASNNNQNVQTSVALKHPSSDYNKHSACVLYTVHYDPLICGDDHQSPLSLSQSEVIQLFALNHLNMPHSQALVSMTVAG